MAEEDVMIIWSTDCGVHLQLFFLSARHCWVIHIVVFVVSSLPSSAMQAHIYFKIIRLYLELWQRGNREEPLPIQNGGRASRNCLTTVSRSVLSQSRK